ncbi:MAG: beta-ketoacyl synthase [Acidobacteria bacterium]|nr:MAG: beta-ketoacyl synthase [Acidobacteriota bacterium]
MRHRPGGWRLHRRPPAQWLLLRGRRDPLAHVIQAVIKGSAINNDGAAKVGYTAPGIRGQAEVIATAQAVAGIEPDTIGYVEAHGTGTTLGDPIEIQALTQVFGSGGSRRAPCLIGSLKTNVGHLDAAAGVARLIKTALSLSHRQIPPSLHFEEPNPKIDFASSPFRVSTQLSEWSRDQTPRRAAVSSFGIGGTNAHVVLEEAPPPLVVEPSRRPWQLLVLSARTKGALDQATRNLAAHVAEHPQEDLADTAYTLQVGRRALHHRRIAVCRDSDDARRALDLQEPGRCLDGEADRTANGVAFLFPGQGTQYVGMGRGLYASEESFHADIDRCAAVLRGALGFDLVDVLYPAEGMEAEASLRLDETAVAQPALFAFEYALARLWMGWGVKPAAFLGHSIGEYVAACLAGVFSLDDALALVAARGRLMQDMPKGSMLAVSLPEADVQSLLDGSLGLAATNGPSQCVISGPHESLAALEERLLARDVDCHRLRTSHAFHSPMMEPVLAAFRERVAAMKRQPPLLRYVSNLTGTWITDEQAVDPAYWARHLRETVRFGQGLGEVIEEGLVLLEVGPGHGLSVLARQPRNGGRPSVAIASTRHARESRSDPEVLLTALGRLWSAGVEVDWSTFHAGERRRRVALPTYPFERQRYWVDARIASAPVVSPSPARPGKKVDVGDWFYRPGWRSSPLPRQGPGDLEGEGSGWLVFADDCGLGQRMSERLEQTGQRAISVTPGEHFARTDRTAYTVRPDEVADYEALFRELKAEGALPDHIAHLWGVTRGDGPAPSLERSQDLGFYSLIFLAQAVGSQNVDKEVGLTIVTSGMQEVSGEGLACPDKATVLGPCRVIPQEYANVRCRSIDVATPDSGVWGDEEIDGLLAECSDGRGDLVVAYRRGERWVQNFEAVRLERGKGAPSRLRQGGVYLITGGLGGIGLELARFLVDAVHARVVLVGRTGLPPREEWGVWRESRGEADGTSRRIAKVQALEASGAEVLVLSADVSDRPQMEDVFARVEARFGEINGVIHSAGVAPGGVIQLKTREMAERVLAPKLTGTLVLQDLLKKRRPDFVVLCSSLASVLGVPGQVDYCAANAFQDAFARHCAGAGGPFVLSLNWDTWREAGMAVESDGLRDFREPEARLAMADGMLSAEGNEVFARALSRSRPQLLVSTVELAPRVERFRALSGPPAARPDVAARHPRPEMSIPYVAPRSPVEQAIADVWQELLGFERVGIHDNFFDLGGHSLLLVQVHRRLRELFPGRVLSVVELFAHSTVAALAAHLSEPPGGPAPVGLEELQVEAERREAGRDRLGRRRGIHTALADPEGADA